MRVPVETQGFSELIPFGDLTVSGTKSVVLDPAFEEGWGFSLDPNLTAFGGGGALALLKSKSGWFGWRLHRPTGGRSRVSRA